MNLNMIAGIVLGIAVICGWKLCAKPKDSFAPETAFIPDRDYKPDLSKGADNFYKSDKLNCKVVKFKNIYGMEVCGNLFTPKDMEKGKKYSAIIVGHPMGAVKEQSANLYAQKMAERGFITLSIDLSFWGKSSGKPRNSVLPDIYAEDFSAAVDFLGTREFIDKEKIGVIGICGSGGFAISAAKIDPRIKAVATISMYDMGTATRKGLKGMEISKEERQKQIKEASAERYNEFQGNERKLTGGTSDALPENPHPVQKEFYDYYRTERGAVGDKTSTHPTLVSYVKFMNFYPFEDIDSISPRPLLFIAGENAHSREFSETAYRKAIEPKELYLVKDAGHVDLYDRVDVIPFDKLDDFFKKNLNN